LYTVNDIQLAHSLINLGVDAVFTDYAHILNLAI
ncbi:MAG: hypothetical protein JWM09_1143, partial [Francisellaceae bacterium]|nr:hypothetical protein [Francisellaceae bacterium]